MEMEMLAKKAGKEEQQLGQKTRFVCMLQGVWLLVFVLAWLSVWVTNYWVFSIGDPMVWPGLVWSGLGS